MALSKAFIFILDQRSHLPTAPSVKKILNSKFSSNKLRKSKLFFVILYFITHITLQHYETYKTHGHVPPYS